MILGGGQDEDENNIRHMLAIKRREKESDGEPIALQDINCDVIPGSLEKAANARANFHPCIEREAMF